MKFIIMFWIKTKALEMETAAYLDHFYLGVAIYVNFECFYSLWMFQVFMYISETG